MYFVQGWEDVCRASINKSINQSINLYLYSAKSLSTSQGRLGVLFLGRKPRPPLFDNRNIAFRQTFNFWWSSMCASYVWRCSAMPGCENPICASDSSSVIIAKTCPLTMQKRRRLLPQNHSKTCSNLRLRSILCWSWDIVWLHVLKQATLYF